MMIININKPRIGFLLGCPYLCIDFFFDRLLLSLVFPRPGDSLFSV